MWGDVTKGGLHLTFAIKRRGRKDKLGMDRRKAVSRNSKMSLCIRGK